MSHLICLLGLVSYKIVFLVECYATLYPLCRSVGPLVHPSVCPLVRLSVRPSHFTFFGFLRSLASLLLHKWCIDLNHGPCPPARDWGCRVSGLVFHPNQVNIWYLFYWFQSNEISSVSLISSNSFIYSHIHLLNHLFLDLFTFEFIFQLYSLSCHNLLFSGHENHIRYCMITRFFVFVII